MKASQKILNHSNYNADDYAYLVAKGWTNSEIAARWTEEAKAGKGPCSWNSYGANLKLASTLRDAR